MSVVRAAVLEPGAAGVVVREVRTPDALAPGQVRVAVRASGVCHSDLHVVDGDWPAEEPLVLGHEGAGVVTETGAGVLDLEVGDHVVLSWFAPCRRCADCAQGRPWTCSRTRSLENRLPDGSVPSTDLDANPVAPFLGLGAFASEVVVGESAVVRVPREVPFEVAALIGCSVATGVGAVVNTAGVRAGQSAVVVGCGGVGLAAVMGLHLVGAGPVIAVDLSDERLATAGRFGAQHLVRGDVEDLPAAVRELTGRGAEFAFECIGRASTIEGLPDLVAPGGAAVLVGMTAYDTTVRLRPFDLADAGKRILGCNYGSSIAQVDFPRLARAHLAGALPLGDLVGRTVALDEIGSALDDLRAARGLRTVVVHD
ncbi:alcohol dehydrogenase catalytic domain-containing protein [Kineococcus rubinsiae]|uniref:alcohol dehydrogenase catalytic domain-containing protein n=1 Tax=Kineococcus rubinsiae TaxID=2609562 RepID=UPI001431D4E9|nr:alcohol dehydrogenase catalytic domain-containing protein [Kineococcus rubinsiae]NIZ90142.1 alcohol dehydrogenase catalytic domain-containing protein [Kineococcus rubinsiae]